MLLILRSSDQEIQHILHLLQTDFTSISFDIIFMLIFFMFFLLITNIFWEEWSVIFSPPWSTRSP